MIMRPPLLISISELQEDEVLLVIRFISIGVSTVIVSETMLPNPLIGRFTRCLNQVDKIRIRLQIGLLLVNYFSVSYVTKR